MATAPPSTTLAQQHDCLLLDLDGTLFRGHRPIDGAVDALKTSQARSLFVTNNASRSAAEVAAHLSGMGFVARADDVVTSAQAAAHLLAGQLTAGARVLVVGTDALASEVASVGLRPVRTSDDDPVAVVQGHSPTTGWAELAEAALAIRSGATWVATNADCTLPTERGLLPGNGSMVAALRAATDREPQLAGKPSPLVAERALQRGRFESPLAVGDRLDTDVAGARTAGIPSLLVLSGVSTAADAICAAPGQRPHFLAPDLRALHWPGTASAIAPHPAWRVSALGATVTVTSTGAAADDDLAVVRAAAHAVWELDADRPLVRAGDDCAAAALRRWGLPA